MRMPQIKTIVAVAGVAIGILSFTYNAGGTTAEYKHVIENNTARSIANEKRCSEISGIQKDVSVIRNDVQWIKSQMARTPPPRGQPEQAIITAANN